MSRVQRGLLAAGLLPLPWFLFWTALGGRLTPGYSGVSQHASELLAAGGAGALCLRVAALGSGVALLAFAAGLWSASARAVPVGAAAWLVFGLSMASNGLWPMGSPMHGLYAAGVVNLVAPGLAHLEVSRLLPGRWAYGLTAAVSVCGVAYLWLNLTGHDPGAFRGLTQRVFSSINAAWPFGVAAAVLARTGLRTA